MNRAITRLKEILAERKLSPATRVGLLIASQSWPNLALLYAEAGRFEKALELFEEARQYISGPDAEMRLDIRRSFLLLRMGRAEEVLRWSRSHPIPWYGMRLEARALAALDSLEAARSVLSGYGIEPLQGLQENYSPRSDLVTILRITVQIELAAGNPESALVILNEIKREEGSSHVLYRELLSRAFQMTGELDRAEREHLALLKVYGGHALSHYELGKIYEEMGRPVDAVSAFTKFLEMWSEADEGLPQVADAQQRLNVLSNDSQ